MITRTGVEHRRKPNYVRTLAFFASFAIHIFLVFLWLTGLKHPSSATQNNPTKLVVAIAGVPADTSRERLKSEAPSKDVTVAQSAKRSNRPLYGQEPPPLRPIREAIATATLSSVESAVRASDQAATFEKRAGDGSLQVTQDTASKTSIEDLSGQVRKEVRKLSVGANSSGVVPPSVAPSRSKQQNFEYEVAGSLRPDCTKVHAEKGLLAIPAIAMDVLRDKGCKF